MNNFYTRPRQVFTEAQREETKAELKKRQDYEIGKKCRQAIATLAKSENCEDVHIAVKHLSKAMKKENWALVDRISGKCGDIRAVDGCKVCGINIMPDGLPKSLPCGVRDVTVKGVMREPKRAGVTCPYETEDILDVRKLELSE